MRTNWLFVSSLFIVLVINNISTTNLRCNENINGAVQLIDNCRACVIFIDAKMSALISPRKVLGDEELAIEGLRLYDEQSYHHRRRRRSDVTIHQKCARESNGPLYGYDQTHCYCDSTKCNSNIQRCIYEVTSKRYFSCYDGFNSSAQSLEISRKCRSCRIRMESNSIYHHECLTFGEQEQTNQTHCTCSYPMCNRDFAICQRFQQLLSPSRVSLNQQVVVRNITTETSTTTTATTSTTTTTTTTRLTSLIANATDSFTTLKSLNQTEEEMSTENATFIELTSLSSDNETLPMTIEMNNPANRFASSFNYLSSIFLSLFIICDL